MACISNDVLPYCDVHADGRGEMSVVLCDSGRGWWDRCYDSLLGRLEAVLSLVTSVALKWPFKRSSGIFGALKRLNPLVPRENGWYGTNTTVTVPQDTILLTNENITYIQRKQIRNAYIAEKQCFSAKVTA